MTSLNTLPNKPSLAPPLAYFSLVMVGLMWTAPFLNYYHAYPITTIYQEWSAAMLGLIAMALLLTADYWRRSEIPRVVLLPVSMMLLLLVQFFLGKVFYFGQMLLYAQYLMWAALLIMLGARLREELGLSVLVPLLSAFLLLGAELNAGLALYQHFHWHSFLDRVVSTKVASAVYGNIAQPNHFADYLTLGLASLGLLYVRGTLRVWPTVLLALPVLFVLPLSGSRGTWIYLLWFAASAFMWQRRERAQRPLLYYSLLVLLGFGLMHLVIQLPWLAVDTGSVNSVQRMFAEDVGSGGVRIFLWRESWLIFTNFPWFGAGFGQYAYQHFQLAPLLHNTVAVGLYNSAHNLVMQLAAETGLAGLLLFFITVGLWLRQAYREQRTVFHWWGHTILAVLTLHSMLEYPLWYAYFIGIAALLLGMLDTSRFRLELGFVGRVFVLTTLVLGAFSLLQFLVGYRDVERMSALHPEPGNSTTFVEQMNRGVEAIQQQALLQPYADLFSCSTINIGPENIDSKLALNGKAEHFTPVATIAYRQALLLAQSGNPAAAQEEMERAIWSYPQDFAMAEGLLRRLILTDSAHFSALLEFTIKTHEEYQIAVHTK